MIISKKSNENEKDINEQERESKFYYALGHEIRRKIIKIIGVNKTSSFTHLKEELKVSTGTIYHHLETLSELIDQDKDKKYYLKELGVYAYNSLKDNIGPIKTPDFVHRELKSPMLRKLMGITSERFIKFEKEDKIYTALISLSILIIGTILCGFNGFYSFFLYFIELDQNDLKIYIQILISFSFILNYLIFFAIIEGISRLFYKKKDKTFEFFISFGIIQLPMILYLVLHLILKISDLISNSIFFFIDKIFLIFFQVWALWLLSFSLCVNKRLKIENSLIISLLLHYGGFSLILFMLI